MNDLTPSTLSDRIARAINIWLVKGGPGATNETYLAALRRLSLPDWKISSLTKDEATLIVQCLYADGFSDNTVALTVRAASSLWTKLMDDHLVSSNPWHDQKIHTPEDKRAQRYLLPWERDALIAAADDHNPRDGLFCRFLYYSLLRVSTAISIRWEQLRPDEQNEWVFITARSKGDRTGTTKVPMRLLMGWVDGQGVDHRGLVQLIGADNIHPEDRVWPFNRNWGYKIVSRAGENAGLGKNVSPHWLRHTGATDALKGGVDLKTLQESLFHARMETTALYLHVEPEHRAGDHLPEV